MGVFDFFKNPNGNDLQAVVSPDRKKKNFLEQFLPEDEDKRQALARALMSGGAAAMMAGGPSVGKPTNLLQALGAGLGSGVSSYGEDVLNQAKMSASRNTARNDQIKLQLAQDKATRAKAFADKYGAPGVNGYSPEALSELFQIQMESGDEAGARDTLGMIQSLQQTASKAGMVVGQNGKYELAGGYGESLFDTKKAESLGSAVGQNAQYTTDRKDFMYGAENPEFRRYEADKAKSNSTNVNVNTAPKDGEIFKALQAEREKAAGSQNGLRLVYEMKQALPNAILGFGSDYLLYGQKAIAALGGDASRVVDTESLKVNAMELAASMKGELVGNQQISDSDMKFVQAVAAGDTSLDGGTIKRLVDIREKQLTGNIQRYNSRIDEIYPDNAENKVNRNYFGGISVPENPHTKKSSPSPSSPSPSGDSAKSSRAGGATVVNSEAEFNALPPGTSFRFADEDVVRVKR